MCEGSDGMLLFGARCPPRFTRPVVRSAQVFVVSNVEDKDPDGVVDFKSGSWRQHRLLAAIAEVLTQK